MILITTAAFKIMLALEDTKIKVKLHFMNRGNLAKLLNKVLLIKDVGQKCREHPVEDDS